CGLPAGAHLAFGEPSKMPLNLPASHEARMRCEKIFEQSRTAAAIAPDIDKPCQCVVLDRFYAFAKNKMFLHVARVAVIINPCGNALAICWGREVCRRSPHTLSMCDLSLAWASRTGRPGSRQERNSDEISYEDIASHERKGLIVVPFVATHI